MSTTIDRVTAYSAVVQKARREPEPVDDEQLAVTAIPLARSLGTFAEKAVFLGVLPPGARSTVEADLKVSLKYDNETVGKRLAHMALFLEELETRVGSSTSTSTSDISNLIDAVAKPQASQHNRDADEFKPIYEKIDGLRRPDLTFINVGVRSKDLIPVWKGVFVELRERFNPSNDADQNIYELVADIMPPQIAGNAMVVDEKPVQFRGVDTFLDDRKGFAELVIRVFGLD